jgi:predicted RND superfamily exporter protein
MTPSGTKPPDPGGPPWASGLARAAVRFRYVIAAAVLALTAACAFPAFELIRLHVRTNLFRLLPETHPSVVDLMRVIEKTGGWGDMMVVIDSADPEANRRFAAALQQRIAALPWITYSEYRTDHEFLERHALLLIARADLDRIRDRLQERYEYEVNQRDPLYVDLLEEGPPPLDMGDIAARYRGSRMLRPFHESADGRTLVLAIYPEGLSGEVQGSRGHLAELRARIASIDRRGYPADLQVRVGGTFVDRLEEYDILLSDVWWSGVLMAVLFVALVLYHFRQAVAVPLVFLTFILPLVWTFALTRAVVAELNMITVFLVNVLSGLGIDFAFHSLTRYVEERSAGRSPVAALSVVYRWTGRACWAAAATTVLAFWAMLFTRFLGYRQFGLIAGFGLTFAFVSAYLVLPALIAIAEDLRLFRHRRPADFPLPYFPRAARPVLVVAVVLAGVGLYGASRVEFEYDLSNLRTRLTPESQALRERIREVLAGTRDPIVVLARDEAQAAEVAARLRERAAPRRPGSEIRAVFAVTDFVPPDQAERLAILADIRSILDRVEPFASRDEQARIAEVRPLLLERPITAGDLPAGLRRRFFGRPGTPGTLVYVLHDVVLTDMRRTAALVEDVRSAEGEPRTWRATSDAIIVHDLLRIMQEDSLLAVSLTLAVVVLVVLSSQRSMRRTSVVMLPLAIGLSWLAALVWLLGIKLNFYNMVAFPSLLGIGVDSGIHIYYRYVENGERSVAEALAHTRGPVAMAALTTIIGFGSLATSAHRGLISMGVMAMLGLGATLIAATVVLPAYLDARTREPASLPVLSEE